MTSIGTYLTMFPLGVMLVITILNATFDPSGWNWNTLLIVFGLAAGVGVIAGINILGSGLNDTGSKAAIVVGVLTIIWTGVIAINWGQLMTIPYGLYIMGGFTMLYMIGMVFMMMEN